MGPRLYSEVTLLLVIAALTVVAPQVANALNLSPLARKAFVEAGELFAKKGPATARNELSERVLAIGAKATEKFGDDGAIAVGQGLRRAANTPAGDEALQAIEAHLKLARPNADVATKFIARYADDRDELAIHTWRLLGRKNAVELMERHGVGIADDIKHIARVGDDLVVEAGEALARSSAGRMTKEVAERQTATVFKELSPESARRLHRILVPEGGAVPDPDQAVGRLAETITATGNGDKFLAVVGKHGQKGMDFIWKNKGSLAVAATLTAFLIDPDPFVNGVKELGVAVVDTTGKVAIEGVRGLAQVASDSVKSPWFMGLAAMIGLVAFVLFRRRRSRHPRRDASLDS